MVQKIVFTVVLVSMGFLPLAGMNNPFNPSIHDGSGIHEQHDTQAHQVPVGNDNNEDEEEIQTAEQRRARLERLAKKRLDDFLRQTAHLNHVALERHLSQLSERTAEDLRTQVEKGIQNLAEYSEAMQLRIRLIHAFFLANDERDRDNAEMRRERAERWARRPEADKYENDPAYVYVPQRRKYVRLEKTPFVNRCVEALIGGCIGFLLSCEFEKPKNEKETEIRKFQRIFYSSMCFGTFFYYRGNFGGRDPARPGFFRARSLALSAGFLTGMGIPLWRNKKNEKASASISTTPLNT